MYAPIALFVYNRPEHTLKTLNALSKNVLSDLSELFIFSDGAQDNNTPEKTTKIREVRQIIKRKKWCKRNTIIEHSKNKGLAESVISGVSQILEKYDRIIVLEDDIITSSGFLQYMNDALNIYHNDQEVMSISGYIFPIKKDLPDTFFLKGGTSTWGWATWKRAWNNFNSNALELIEMFDNNKSLIKEFNFNDAFNYYEMLCDSATGKNYSWGVRWYASVFLKEGLGLYPGKSLVNNIGFDNTGIHSGFTNLYYHNTLKEQLTIKKNELKHNAFAKKQIERFYKSPHRRIFTKLFK